MKLGSQSRALTSAKIQILARYDVTIGARIMGRHLVDNAGVPFDASSGAAKLRLLDVLCDAVTILFSSFDVERLRADMAFIRRQGGEFFCTVTDQAEIIDDYGRRLKPSEIGEFINAVSKARARFAREASSPNRSN